MKRLLLVLPLLCGLALGQEYDKERYEKDLKDYNENHQSALSLASRAQKAISLSNILFDYSTHSHNLKGEELAREVSLQSENFLKIEQEAKKNISPESDFASCVDMARTANALWEDKIILADAVAAKDGLSQGVAAHAYNNLGRSQIAYERALSNCLELLAEPPPAPEDYSRKLSTVETGVKP